MSTWSQRWPAVAIVLSILAATALVYWPGLGGGFIFDDFQNLLMNPAIAGVDATPASWVRAMFSSPASELQRPLSMLSFAANHYFSGFDSRAMKLTNLGVHSINVVLVFALLRRLGAAVHDEASSLRVAAIATAAWAVHPINLMVVLYVVQRMESLSHLFVLLGLLLYVLGRQRQLQGKHGMGLVLSGLGPCTVLAILAKESGALLPLYAILLEACLFRFRRSDGVLDRRLLAVYGLTLFLPALLGLTWLLPRSLAPGAFGSRNFDLAERLLTEGRVLCDYLRWIVLPDLGRLSLYHDDYLVSRGLFSPWTTLPALLLLGAMAAAAFLLRRRKPLIALGLAWFLSAHLLTATIVPLELVFEHRNYFASLGLLLALAELCVISPQPRLRVLGAVLAAAMFLFYAGTTRLRASEWSNALLFAETEAAKHPHSARATYELARMLIIAGGYDLDSPYTRKAPAAVRRAMAVGSGDALPAQAALMLASRTGQPLRPDWWEQLQERLRDKPGSPENQMALVALSDCAEHHLCAFPPDDMIASFLAALEKGDEPVVLSSYGRYALLVLHDPALALRLWTEAVRLDPRKPQYLIELAQLEMGMGRYREAGQRIDSLRHLGELGQYDPFADRLAAQLQNARASHPAPDRPLPHR